MSDHDVHPTGATAPPQKAVPKDIGLWAEPWHFAPRPRTEFWDASSAGWRSGDQVPSPRSGD